MRVDGARKAPNATSASAGIGGNTFSIIANTAIAASKMEITFRLLMSVRNRLLETYREISASLFEAYLSTVSNRMNDIIPGTRLEGRILIEGHDIYGNGTDVVALRKKVGMVFQKSNPFPKSIYENIAYGLRARGAPNKAVNERVPAAARMFRIDDLLKRKPRQLVSEREVKKMESCSVPSASRVA